MAVEIVVTLSVCGCVLWRLWWRARPGEPKARSAVGRPAHSPDVASWRGVGGER